MKRARSISCAFSKRQRKSFRRRSFCSAVRRRESREPPVRETVQDFWLPDDGRHPGEDPLGILLQSFFAELPVEPLGEVGQMGGVEGGIVELLLR